MQPRIFTLRYSSTIGGFDDTPLREYTRGREVLAFREHFFTVSDVPHLACVVTTQAPPVGSDDDGVAPGRGAGAGDGNERRRVGTPDPTEGLDERQRLIFNALREWRSETAREEGVPPFVVLTNRELVAIISARPDSLTALGHVRGIGPAKLKRYGSAILKRLNHGGECEAEDEIGR